MTNKPCTVPDTRRLQQKANRTVQVEHRGITHNLHFRKVQSLTSTTAYAQEYYPGRVITVRRRSFATYLALND